MLYIHNAKITIFLKPEEYFGNKEMVEKIKNIFHSLVPIDFDKEKLQITEEEVTGFDERKIKILKFDITKEAHTKIFIKKLKEMLGEEQYSTLIKQKESRLDEDLFFYIRLDKEAMLKNVAELTDNGDCVHIRLHIAAFPKNREAALKVIEEIFK